MKKIFNESNTWMPAAGLRLDGYNPSSASLPIFGILACGDAQEVPIGKTIKGNTSNGRNNVSNYNNDLWWQSTGPEIVHKLVWPGGEGTIKVSNKSAGLDLILLRSCDNNDFLDSGGGNSGTGESIIARNLPAGTYYIVVDGWQQAKGAYDLLVTQKGVTPTLDIIPRASIHTYPNPFTTVLNLEVILTRASPVEIEITDIMGRILRVNNSHILKDRHNIQIHDLDYKGVFFVKVRSREEYGIVKVIRD